eukprot:6782450-Alexandrium_andersonii.AAC.1
MHRSALHFAGAVEGRRELFRGPKRGPPHAAAQTEAARGTACRGRARGGALAGQRVRQSSRGALDGASAFLSLWKAEGRGMT